MAVDAIFPLGCRGEHCSPVRFSPLGGITGSVARAVNDRPYGLTRYVVATASRQGGVKTPPYITTRKRFFDIYSSPYRAMIFYCPVGRGDPTPPGKSLPLGGKVARLRAG